MAKKRRKKRKKLTEEEKEKRKHRKDIRAVFRHCGFTKVLSVSNKEFTFKGRTGDIDDIFIFENIIILAEHTCSGPSHGKLSTHLLKKKVLFDIINNNKKEFIKFLEERFESFKETRNKKYSYSQSELIIIYCSRYKLENKHKKHLPQIKFLDYPILQYFLGISKVIKRSDRFELFSFLGLEYNNIGEKVLDTSSGGSKDYEGHILPEEHSSFEQDFKVVSFYIDAESLMNRSYVLRKEGWKDIDGLYQRMLIKKKIEKMRQYLDVQKRVFINNIIVTLPSKKTELLDAKGKVVKLSEVGSKTQPITIRIDEGFNIIGLVDGQHRVYAYHEGTDKYEKKISELRKIQNLLTTGIIYPERLNENKRLEFEANLFLEINATQTGAKSELKQSIELLLKPFSTVAIAKAVVNMLNDDGPLETYLEEYFYEKGKIKTTSIVSYGLKPIVKLSGDDSLFKLWSNPHKKELIKGKDYTLLDTYRKFCTKEINKILAAYRKNVPPKFWTTNQKISKFLTPTSINGLISCLRLLIENNKTGDIDYYQEKLKEVSKFNFDIYKSSQWNSLGIKLYETYFS